jgi:phosphoribosyl 1,2-cyclic phosphodiesterase
MRYNRRMSPANPGSNASDRNGCLRVNVLGSGSQGNCTVVSSGDDAILLDAGFSAREILRRLCAAGSDPGQVRAIVLTHEHTDHVSGVRVLAKRLGVPVYATRGTAAQAALAAKVDDPRRLKAGETLAVGALRVTAFRTSHDAAEPIGVRVCAPDGDALGLVTDTGVMTPESLEVLQGCSVLALETNHDERMLREGPYPWFLKQRILSSRGHLSNAAAAEVVERLAHDGLRTLIGMHASRTNNTTDMANRSLVNELERLGLPCAVSIASQEEPLTCTNPSGDAMHWPREG